MSIDENERFVEGLKKIKDLKDNNRKKVEKLRNIDLENKKKLISNIVNLQTIIELIQTKKIFNPKDESSRLVWIDNNDNIMTIDECINILNEMIK